MYRLASRHAAALFGSRFLGRFLPESAMVAVRQEYTRYGVAGLFIGRLLPGFRAVVAPFAGLMHLSFLRAFIPMALASAVWHGDLSCIPAQLANQPGRIIEVISEINHTLGIVSGAIVGVLAPLLMRRRRRLRAAAMDDEAGQ